MHELVVTDLDGTLWDGSIEIHPSTRSALAELERRGVPVLAATGRRPRSAREGLAAIGVELPGVMLDGTIGELASAASSSGQHGERFHTAAFENATADLALDRFLAHDIRPCVFIDDPDLDVLLDPMPSTIDRHSDYISQWALERSLADGVGEHSVLALTVVGGEREQFEAVARVLTDEGLAHVTVSDDSVYGGASLAALPVGVSKWSGVVSFCDRMGIDAANVLAVGDAANDVPMLRQAATAVVVRSGSADVLAVADHLIDRPEEGGWAAVVDLLG